MKKLFLFFLFVAMTTGTFAQKMNEYTASNGLTYHIGDTITIGRGSDKGGNFVYCQMGGAYDVLNVLGGTGKTQEGLPKQLAGRNMIIKSIKSQKSKGGERVFFNVAGGNMVYYKIWVEDALSSGELKSCGYTSDEALNELKKAKDKLDLQLINQHQFDSIKNVMTKFIK